MVTPTVQTMYTNHWRVHRTALARGATAVSACFLHVMALVVLSLGAVSCAELTNLQDDIAGLRADLHAHNETLAKISARVDELERRQSISEHVSGQMLPEVTQAIEVLLKKALVTENRLTNIEFGGLPAKAAEKPVKQTGQPGAPAQGPAVRGRGGQAGAALIIQPSPNTDGTSGKATALRLGMVPEDVRRALGDPISTETSASYIFWYYSRVHYQKYVIFEKDTRQVSGWWGL